jgi:hypothetical protein
MLKRSGEVKHGFGVVGAEREAFVVGVGGFGPRAFFGEGVAESGEHIRIVRDDGRAALENAKSVIGLRPR